MYHLSLNDKDINVLTNIYNAQHPHSDERRTLMWLLNQLHDPNPLKSGT